MIKHSPVFFLLPLMLLPAIIAGAAGRREQPAEAFSVSLPVPPILEAETAGDGTKVYALTAREGEREFFPGTPTETAGYNGSYLGPTILVRRGERVRFNIKNELKEATSVHWHGAHVPAEMDGGPHQNIESGSVWSPEFLIDQEAATLWYHPHLIPTTAEQVYRGLAGLFIIEDEYPDSLDIPSEYGTNDIPLIVQDRKFDRDGTFSYGPGMPEIMHGYQGNVVMVNGAIQPYLDVDEPLIRLRLLNGSNSSIFRFRFGDGVSFAQIASDGGFLEQAVAMEYIVLSPGERAELLVDFGGRKRNDEVDLLAETSSGEEYRILRFRMKKNFTADASGGIDYDTPLNTIEKIPPSEASRERRFIMSSMGPGGRLTINGKRMDMSRIDERVPLGATEIWTVENGSGMGGRMGMMNTPHSFHLHDGQFQILDINGSSPPPGEAGWKDTVLLWPGDRIRLIKRFEEFTGIYMYHCHLLEHEDAGMMGQFEVLSP
jgi:FtsP/CotA-like multicopper oxidase with cupredoxin domain